MNIYQHIDKNKKETLLIMAGFIIVVTFIGWIIGEVNYSGGGMALVPMALVVAGLSSLFSYYNSDKIVLAISGAREVSKEQQPSLHNLVENMSIASGIPKPGIFLIGDTAMNAFTTGRDPKHSILVFTTGIIQSLEKRELEGVIAHEMSHIGNYDTRLMSIVSVLVGTITLLSDWFTRGALYGGRRSNRDSGVSPIFLMIGIILIILSPIIATLIKLAVSRNREYLADSTAALITRYPAGLAGALRKLSGDREILEAANGATAHLYITSPLRADVSGVVGKLFSTHPPIEDRIKRLEAM